MTRIERAQEFNRRMRAQRDALGVVPELVSAQVVAAKGEAGEMRALAATLAPMAELLPVRDWAVGMTTAPGDIVRSPDGKYEYIYAKDVDMTHSNYTFFPGAAGVYYWSIIPHMHEGVKVYPSITDIVVAVKQGEIWWNREKTKKYRWTGADNKACNWYPGQAGVHQWVVVTE